MSDKQCPIKKTSIGGQALIEGIMMRGPEKTAMAIRNPKGAIVMKEWKNSNKVSKLSKIPFVRGIFNMVSSLVMGYKCLSESAEIAMDLEELERQEKEEKELKALKKRAKKEGIPYEELLAEYKASKEPVAEAETAEEVVIEDSETVEETPVAVEENEETVVEETYAPEETEITKEAPVEAVESDEKADKKEKKKDSEMGWVMLVSVVFALFLVVGLFVFLPEFIYKLAFGEFPENPTYFDQLGRSAFTGLIKLILLIGYMWAVSFMKDIKRTFMYHGAEHKTIFCYERGLELTTKNVRAQKRFHPRCGTSFIVLVVLVGIILGSFIQFNSLLPRMLSRIVLVPLIVGIGYELIKLAGKKDNLITRIISAPGVWLQHITTKEPTDDMIECAIRAISEVIPEDKESDNW